MFDKLIPWKKKAGDLKMQSDDDSIVRLRRDFDELWDRYLGAWQRGGLVPRDESGRFGSRIDFDDKENEYVLRAEVPGFEPREFDVKVSGNVLTLRAEHTEEGKKNGGYRQYGSFYESFTLPQGVLPEKIDARYHSGVLELHLPKSEECHSKRIEVNTS